jgi:hypothetical protein
MRRNEVLSLLERFPELVDGDDDELLHTLISEAGPELSEKDPTRPIEALSKVDAHGRPVKQPR